MSGDYYHEFGEMSKRRFFSRLATNRVGFPEKIHEEKPSFSDFEKNWLRTDGRADGPTDRRTDRPSYRDARTHLKIGTK